MNLRPVLWLVLLEPKEGETPRAQDSLDALRRLNPDVEPACTGDGEIELTLEFMVIRIGQSEGDVQVRLPKEDAAAAREALQGAWTALRALALEGAWELRDCALDEPVDLDDDFEVVLHRLIARPAPWYVRFLAFPLLSGAVGAGAWMLGFSLMVLTFWLVEVLAKWGLPREPATGGASFFLEGLMIAATIGFVGGVLVGIPFGALLTTPLRPGPHRGTQGAPIQ